MGLKSFGSNRKSVPKILGTKNVVSEKILEIQKCSVQKTVVFKDFEETKKNGKKAWFLEIGF